MVALFFGARADASASITFEFGVASADAALTWCKFFATKPTASFGAKALAFEAKLPDFALEFAFLFLGVPAKTGCCTAFGLFGFGGSLGVNDSGNTGTVWESEPQGQSKKKTKVLDFHAVPSLSLVGTKFAS